MKFSLSFFAFHLIKAYEACTSIQQICLSGFRDYSSKLANDWYDSCLETERDIQHALDRNLYILYRYYHPGGCLILKDNKLPFIEFGQYRFVTETIWNVPTTCLLVNGKPEKLQDIEVQVPKNYPMEFWT